MLKCFRVTSLLTPHFHKSTGPLFQFYMLGYLSYIELKVAGRFNYRSLFLKWNCNIGFRDIKVTSRLPAFYVRWHPTNKLPPDVVNDTHHDNYLRVNSNQEVKKALGKAKAFMKTGLFKTRMMSMKISEHEPHLRAYCV